MKRGRLAVAGFVALVAASCICQPPPQVPPDASACDATPCQDDEISLRFGNRDYLVAAPGIWLFFEDFAARLPPDPRCGVGERGDGGLRPLWRRVLSPHTRGDIYVYDNWGTSSRNGLAVGSDRVAVNLGALLWLFDARTGTPQHLFWALTSRPRRADAGWDSQGVSLHQRMPFAAFTPDGKMLWIHDVLAGPALLDLEAIDRRWGVPVVFDWYEDVVRPRNQPVSVDFWKWPAPAIGWDGTLFWKSNDGSVRALETSGRVRWEKWVPAGGHAFLDGSGSSHWSTGTPPLALRALDGSRVWEATPVRPDVSDAGFAVEVERPTPRRFVPIRWPVGGVGHVIAAHDLRDGSIAWTVPAPYGSATAQALDGTVYLSFRVSSLSDDTVGRLLALEPDAGSTIWSMDFPLPEGYVPPENWRASSLVSVGPIPAERKDGVYVVSENCKVYDIANDGGVRAWYRMEAPPLGHVPQLVDGVLYVLARASTEAVLQPGERACPWEDRQLALDRYQCLSGTILDCYPCIDSTEIYFLYAFQVE